MGHRFQCRCGAQFGLEARVDAEHVRCPGCGVSYRVPASAKSAAAASPHAPSPIAAPSGAVPVPNPPRVPHFDPPMPQVAAGPVMPSQVVPPQVGAPPSRKGPWIIGGVVALVLLGGGGYFLWQHINGGGAANASGGGGGSPEVPDSQLTYARVSVDANRFAGRRVVWIAKAWSSEGTAMLLEALDDPSSQGRPDGNHLFHVEAKDQDQVLKAFDSQGAVKVTGTVVGAIEKTVNLNSPNAPSVAMKVTIPKLKDPTFESLGGPDLRGTK